jgi:hypothetical protein
MGLRANNQMRTAKGKNGFRPLFFADESIQTGGHPGT